MGIYRIQNQSDQDYTVTRLFGFCFFDSYSIESFSQIVKTPYQNHARIFGKMTILLVLLIRLFDFHSLFIYSQFRLSFVSASPKRKWERQSEKHSKNHEQKEKSEKGIIFNILVNNYSPSTKTGRQKIENKQKDSSIFKLQNSLQQNLANAKSVYRFQK